MVNHFETASAAEAHLVSKGFRKGRSYWFKDELRADIKPISGSDWVALFMWQA